VTWTSPIGPGRFPSGRRSRFETACGGSAAWSPYHRASDSLEVYLLGLVDFDSALFLQERLVYEVSGRNDRLGGLLICEHPPIVTVGREGSREHFLADRREFDTRLMEIRWLNRGGGCVVHAPGQLAVYPIVPLDRLGIGLANYRRRLEQAVLQVCCERRVLAFRNGVQPGIWCRSGRVASLGVAVKSWVAYHGLYLNVCPALDLSRMVKPADDGGRVSSLAAQSLRPISMHSIRESLVHHLSSALGYDQHHIYTGHPLLSRTTRKIRAYA
jgi:lipoyl(octanoyl) transferase